MKEQRRRSTRFPIADIEFSSPDLPGEVVELSRTGLRLTTPLAIEVGQPIVLTLSYREETVRLSGVVRWRRQAGFVSRDDTLAYWEVGVAFTKVGEASPDGIWRSLTVGRRGTG